MLCVQSRMLQFTQPDLPVWINVTCNLATLLAIYKKRSDTQEEYPALNIMVEQMKELVSEKFPYMKDYFVRGCDIKQCFHCKAGYKTTCIFKRDEKHRQQDGIKNWNLHEKTKQELMLDCEPYETEYYVGNTKTTEDVYKNAA